MSLDKQPSVGTVIANGVDSYNFRLRIRDQYGNATGGGKIEIVYITQTRANQIDFLEMPEY